MIASDVASRAITVERMEVIVASTTDGGHRLKTFGYLLDHAVRATAEAKPWHTIIECQGYEGVDYPENDTPMASIGNRTSFWHTEGSVVRLFADTGFARATLIDPIFRSVHGARRFYLLSAC